MARSTRYQVEVTREKHGQLTTEMVQAHSRRKDALRRARSIAHDRTGWPSATEVRVIDTAAVFTSPVVGRFARS